MSEKLLSCPFCGADAEIDEDVSGSGNFPTRYLASCSKCCGMIEEWWNTPEEAAAAWNRRAQPENEPLTLDELRGMGGEPVWIQESAPYTFAGYKILCSPVVDEYEDVCFEGGDCYYSHDYGKTWLAYRAKPERSEGE